MDINKKRNIDRDLSRCLQSLDSHKITERKVITIGIFVLFAFVIISITMVIIF